MVLSSVLSSALENPYLQAGSIPAGRITIEGNHERAAVLARRRIAHVRLGESFQDTAVARS
jgi:hypothetical protein